MAMEEAISTEVFGEMPAISTGINASALATGVVFVVGAAIAWQIGKNFMQSANN